MTYAIKAENLSKKYIIKHNRERYHTLRDTIANGLKNSFKRTFSREQECKRKEELWALKDISFEVKHGERIGIIGRNGAGKSTLLKLLSRITTPTSGQAHINGRLSSLLEVGTGFHPELTGRENIFLNGSILGMTRAEIKRRFDEIVSFAEIEKFLDTPVKRYSSGMYVRLAFAVASCLESDTLIIDEVLAVGDIHFQKKCLNKMNDVTSHGRTILFVSHNMGIIKNLCPRTIFLKDGKMVSDGETTNVINTYLEENLKYQNAVVSFNENTESPFYIKKASLLNEAGTPSTEFYLNSKIFLEIEYVVKKDIRQSIVLFSVARDSIVIFQSHDSDLNPKLLESRHKGIYKTRVQLPQRLLTAGKYIISLSASVGLQGQFGHDGHPDALVFYISEDDEYVIGKSWGRDKGNYIIVEPEWTLQ